MLIAIIILTVVIAVAAVCLWRLTVSYNAKRELLLSMALNGQIEGRHLKTKGKERMYAIIYRTYDGYISSHMITATNDIEAQFLFVKETENSAFRIQRVQKL